MEAKNTSRLVKLQARGKRRTVQKKVKAWGVVNSSGLLLVDGSGKWCAYTRKEPATRYALRYLPAVLVVACSISYTLPRRKGAK